MAVRTSLTAALAGAGLSFCLGVAAATADTPKLAPDLMAESTVGAYLSGRHAMAANDREAAAVYLKEALKDDPQNEQLRRRLFWVLLGAGQPTEAVDYADAASSEGGDATVAALLLSIERVRAGDWAGAEQRLAKLSRSNINRFLVPLVLGWVQAGAGKTDEALATLKAVGEQQGNGILRDLHCGLVAELAKRPEQAGQFYAAALQAMPRMPLRMVEAIGGFYERTGKAAEAKPLYQDYAEDNPESAIGQILLERAAQGKTTPPIVASARDGLAEALFHFASALQQERSAEFALVLTRLALHLRPDLDAAQMLVAGILEQQQRNVDANKVYQSIAPGSWFSWSARLRVASNLEAMEKFDDAEALLRAMGKERTDRVDALAQLGGMLRTKERFAEAVAVYDDTLKRVDKIDKRHWSLLYARGIALERSKQWARAEADFLRALELQPDQPYVLNYLGYSWIDQGINLDRGMDMIRRAVEQRPNDGYIVDSLGWAHYRLGNYDKAAEHLERAVELRPVDPTINDHLGDAYWKVGRVLEARFQWKRAQGLKPDAELASQLEKKLKDGLTASAPGQRGG
ncbi:MAG: tetratricopeptide repeat protein [Alphaproteobacteria bacterium]|nr:tetratricopeptide repeat protein [Alphaproteobacteria bacterium]